MLTTIFVLLLVYQLKHFLADYPLQTSYMLGKFKAINWQWPLMAHAGVHAAFTAVISLVFLHLRHQDWSPDMRLEGAVLCAYFDFGVHFAMDRIKASPAMMGRWKALDASSYRLHAMRLADPEIGEGERAAIKRAQRHNTYFWWALGFDQLVHHLTHYAIIAGLVLS
jgi:hypothetical protein